MQGDRDSRNQDDRIHGHARPKDRWNREVPREERDDARRGLSRDKRQRGENERAESWAAARRPWSALRGRRTADGEDRGADGPEEGPPVYRRGRGMDAAHAARVG